MDVTTPISAQIVDLGRREYADVWKMQLDLVQRRQRDEVPDTLLLVEHPHVLTLGRATKRQNLIAPSDMPVFEIERGGDVTYHGPGQLVGYPIFQLRESERDLHVYMRNLEEALIRTVGDFGIAGGRKAGSTGMWTAQDVTPQRKLASIGIAVKRWVTMHGFALNVGTDLSRFAVINPCGLDSTVMASMTSCLGREVTLDDVRGPVVQHFCQVFNRRFQPAEAPSISA